MSNSKVGLGFASFVALVAIEVAIYEGKAVRQAQSLTEPQLAAIRVEGQLSGLGPSLDQFRANNPA